MYYLLVEAKAWMFYSMLVIPCWVKFASSIYKYPNISIRSSDEDPKRVKAQTFTLFHWRQCEFHILYLNVHLMCALVTVSLKI